MREEIAGKMEADGERLSFGRFAELDDRPLHLTFADAEHSHSVHGRTDLVDDSASDSLQHMTAVFVFVFISVVVS